MALRTQTQKGKLLEEYRASSESFCSPVQTEVGVIKLSWLCSPVHVGARLISVHCSLPRPTRAFYASKCHSAVMQALRASHTRHSCAVRIKTMARLEI
jgi:hypothetical protein